MMQIGEDYTLRNNLIVRVVEEYEGKYFSVLPFYHALYGKKYMDPPMYSRRRFIISKRTRIYSPYDYKATLTLAFRNILIGKVKLFTKLKTSDAETWGVVNGIYGKYPKNVVFRQNCIAHCTTYKAALTAFEQLNELYARVPFRDGPPKLLRARDVHFGFDGAITDFR